ncbi:hypothetical protein PR003_g28880 [Phytophthora rubi]|uniref:Uncharacterized protein n=1 Tax=Phytophthora rubi TaxID=129364 RepID=A0A6A3HNW1_9STRA|nr:hypothetical protein PR002_g27408 [Phytophthora rubi]KAE9277092.1 hypothetical protein PR003_g28880 [Phytophthora rubi]
MLSLTESFVLMLLACASGIQTVRGDCNWVCSDKSTECSTTGLLKGGENFLVSAPGCTATQYAYVTGVTISRVTEDDAPVSFSYAIDSACSASGLGCEDATSLTCGKGADKDANVTITCDSDCELKYQISWACADISTPTPTSTSTATSTSTTPNAAWTQARAGLLGLLITALAALSQM